MIKQSKKLALILATLAVLGFAPTLQAHAETTTTTTTTTTTVTTKTDNTNVQTTTGAAVTVDVENGWLLEAKGSDRTWYYYRHGKPVKGERTIGDNEYFFDSKGKMISNGWVVDGTATDELDTEHWDTTYYYDNEGRKVFGWYRMDNYIQYPYGNWMFFDEKGRDVKGWLADRGSWYFLDYNNGRYRVGWYTVSGQKYNFDLSGRMHTGWLYDNGRWYYFNSNGSMQTGWVKSGSNWYFLAPDGAMVSNCYIGSYHVGSDGAWDN